MKEIIEKIISSRALRGEDSYVIYDFLQDEIFHQRKMHPIHVYLYGYDDESNDDSSIWNFSEYIFFTLLEEPFNKRESDLVEVFVKYFEIFVPHAINWYGDITNWLLYHYKENPCEEFKRNIRMLSENQRGLLGNILKNSNKDSFIYDDKGRVEREYNEIIEICFLALVD